MNKIFTILIISLFIFSCNDSNPVGIQCDEGLTELNGECVDQCGTVQGDNTNECGNCEDYVSLWGECYSIQETTEIDLLTTNSNWGEDLTGSIPSSIGRLVNLTSLKINNRYLSGSIPIEIGDLVNLIHLNISNQTPHPSMGSYVSNQMSGSIPIQIGELINLTSLDLGDNGLTGEIPSELGNLINLTSLDLGSNSLTGEIPTGIGDLISLTSLLLDNNELEGSLFESFCELENVDFRNNKFCPQFPTCLELYLIGYQECSECDSNYSYQQDCLSSIDIDVIQMFINSNIETINFDMDFNENGIIEPLEFGYQTWENGRIIELDCYNRGFPPVFSDCGISNIPSDIEQLEYIEIIMFRSNLIIGNIPSEIFNLSNLTYLNLMENQLSGEIPSETGNLVNLNYLILSSNQLSGVIPEEICNQGDSTPSVGNNKLCTTPYPSCISQDDIDSQDCP